MQLFVNRNNQFYAMFTGNYDESSVVLAMEPIGGQGKCGA